MTVVGDGGDGGDGGSNGNQVGHSEGSSHQAKS